MEDIRLCLSKIAARDFCEHRDCLFQIRAQQACDFTSVYRFQVLK